MRATIHRFVRGASDDVVVQAFRFLVVGLIAFAVDFSLLLIAVEAW